MLRSERRKVGRIVFERLQEYLKSGPGDRLERHLLPISKAAAFDDTKVLCIETV